MNTGLLKRSLAALLVAATVLNLRAGEEQDLIATLQSKASVPVRCAACQRLRVVGTAKSVPALAALLTEIDTAHAARYALAGMPYPEAGAALRQALANSGGAMRIGLIDSLGWRRDAEAVPLLSPLLSSSDVEIASASAVALGRIGSREAVGALNSKLEKAQPGLQTAICEGLLDAAESMMERGDSAGAIKVYRSLFRRELPSPTRVAAWRGWVVADSAKRPALIASALEGADPELQTAAAKTIRELPEPAVLEACLPKWEALSESSQLAVLDAQVKLGAAALPAVRTASQSRFLSVRVAAWEALGDLGAPDSISALAGAVLRGEPAEREAARESLARLRGPGVSEAIGRYLAVAGPQEKAVLLRAMGDRGDETAVALLLESAAASTDGLRVAALESLRKLAVGSTLNPLLKLAARSRSEEECQPVLEAIYAVCQASPDRKESARQVLGAFAAMSVTERALVLPLLPEFGTPEALEVAVAATREADPAVVRAGVQALGQWPNAAPTSRLLELARSTPDATLQVLALRGSIQTAAHEPDLGRRFAWLNDAMAAAKRPEEKRQALAQIAQVPTAEALQTALAQLETEDLSSEAGQAALTIVEKLAAANPQLAKETASKVLQRCKAPDLVRRAWALRGKPVGAAPFIQDWQVSGPYRKPGAEGALALFDVVFDPEKPGQTAAWKPVPRGEQVNLAGIFPNETGCVAYLRARIEVPSEAEAALLLGSDDGVKAWLNGAVVHANNVDRGDLPDQDMAPIRLRAGRNELVLKITQGGGGWSARARIVGPEGQTIAGLRVLPPE